MSCPRNIYKFNDTVSTCAGSVLLLPYSGLVVGGTYVLKLSYLSSDLQFSLAANSSGKVSLPTEQLNEHYGYTGQLFDSAGNLVMINAGTIYYDTILFITRPGAEAAIQVWTTGEYVPPSAGASSSSITIDVIAGETVSGGKAVVIDDDNKAYVFSTANENHVLKVFGIAKQSASAGSQLEVYVGGQAYEAGAGWQVGKVYYVSATGVLSVTQPSTGIIKQAGIGIATDTILIDSSSFSIIKI